jgi:hypothetical protein
MSTQAPIKIQDADDIDVNTSGTLLDNGHTRPTVGIGGPDGAAALCPVSATDGMTVNLGSNNDVTVTTLPADPLGANADAAATAGSTGSVSAKLRLMTSQLDAIQTAVQVLDNAIAGSEMQVDIVGGGLTPARAATSTMANVNDSATSVTLQASNANRLALIVVNDSTEILYVKYGSTASTTSFTHKLHPNESIREDLYTGIVTGIWAADASGAARMTELTA